MNAPHIIKVPVASNEITGQVFARLYGAASDISDADLKSLLEAPAGKDFGDAWAATLENVRFFDKVAGRHYKPFIHPKEGLILLGAKAEISCDRDTSSPRIDEDTIAVMFCNKGRKTTYGDEDAESPFEKVESDDEGDDGVFEDDEEQEEERFALRSDVLFYLPIFLYDHSGLAFSHDSFNDRWDSGQIGFHYITREAFAEAWPSVDPDSDEAKEICRSCLKAELETYADWVNGNTWAFDVCTLDDEEIESCGGFIGKLDYGDYPVLESMKEHVDGDLGFLLDQAAENPTY